MSEFSDRPLVAGSITGLRTFRPDALGRLTGVIHRDVWTPGENVAVCHKNEGSIGGLTFHLPSMSSLCYGSAGELVIKPSAAPKPQPVSLTKKPKHVSAGLKCTCGFYAYFDNDGNQYHETGMIKAIIDGYGTVTVGSRGFRSSKAAITALIIPKRRRTRATDQIVENYGVPLYDSRVQAIYHHPLTPPALPSPDTDPEFWTRAVSS